MSIDFDRYLKDIIQSPVYDVAIESPLEEAQKLSQRLHNTILFKREDSQSVFSFKLRGAYHRMFYLSQEEKQAGVICSSAGNHAQGVALASSKLGISAKIVMPKTTPSIKVDSVRSLGATVLLVGDNYDEAYILAQRLAAEEKRVFIPPFDDEMVICGQGTVGMEIVRQSSGRLPDMIFVPVGGGGLAAGIAVLLRQMAPSVKLIAVEAEDSACLQAALQVGKRVVLKEVGIFADGVSVKQVGQRPWDILKDTISEVITVNTDEICAAIRDCFEQTRTVVEPSGALALAGLKKKVLREGLKNQRLVSVISGANMNFDRLQYIVERAEVGDQREAILGVTISERPGSFLKFCKIIGKILITEFNYRYADDNDAHIFVGVKLQGMEQKKQLLEKLAKHNYLVIDLSQDDLSKNHIRHMVGGRASGVNNEKLYRFNFPERPGALLDFLQLISRSWNISMFHYRNHGSAFGRVLVGLQISDDEVKHFLELVNSRGLIPIEETRNEAYRLFCLAT